MIDIYDYTIMTNIQDKKYINKIDSAILYNTETDRYFGGIIYYTDDITSELGLIIDLNGIIYFKSGKVFIDDIDFIKLYIADNMNSIKNHINRNAETLIQDNEFEKL